MFYYTGVVKFNTAKAVPKFTNIKINIWFYDFKQSFSVFLGFLYIFAIVMSVGSTKRTTKWRGVTILQKQRADV